MRQGTINNYIKFSKNFGGVRKCYEGKPEIAVGGFMCEPELMPVYPNVMAAGTLVKYDETKGVRSIVPIYTFKVKSVDATAKTITVEKPDWYSTAGIYSGPNFTNHLVSSVNDTVRSHVSSCSHSSSHGGGHSGGGFSGGGGGGGGGGSW
jgi:uncharacterized membrane protein YgcG